MNKASLLKNLNKLVSLAKVLNRLLPARKPEPEEIPNTPPVITDVVQPRPETKKRVRKCKPASNGKKKAGASGAQGAKSSGRLTKSSGTGTGRNRTGGNRSVKPAKRK